MHAAPAGCRTTRAGAGRAPHAVPPGQLAGRSMTAGRLAGRNRAVNRRHHTPCLQLQARAGPPDRVTLKRAASGICAGQVRHRFRASREARFSRLRPKPSAKRRTTSAGAARDYPGHPAGIHGRRETRRPAEGLCPRPQPPPAANHEDSLTWGRGHLINSRPFGGGQSSRKTEDHGESGLWGKAAYGESGAWGSRPGARRTACLAAAISPVRFLVQVAATPAYQLWRRFSSTNCRTSGRMGFPA